MTDRVPKYEPLEPDTWNGASNMPLLLIAAGFLCVTIVLVLLQPGLDRAPTRIAATQDGLMSRTAHSDVTFSVAPALTDGEAVTRTRVPVFDAAIVPGASTSELITRELLNPARQADTSRQISLPDLTELVVTRFDIKGEAALGVHDGLKSELVHLILQRQPDAEIADRLAAAKAQSVFRVPAALLTTTGTLDSGALLAAMAEGASGYRVQPSEQIGWAGRHVVQAGDSISGLALRYYGSPFDYPDILKANAWINPNAPVLIPGNELRLPPL